MIDLGHCSGIKIYQSPYCLEETRFPIKKHEEKRWMKGSYHNRIQKKWNKRFGYEMKPCMFETSMGILCHPSIYKQIKEQLS